MIGNQNIQLVLVLAGLRFIVHIISFDATVLKSMKEAFVLL